MKKKKIHPFRRLTAAVKHACGQVSNTVSRAARSTAGTVRRIYRYGVRPVFWVFCKDIRTITHNGAALLVAVGLCILPSLYAWINIYACWDPYSNTGNLPVAIVNNDEGTVFSGKTVNVGDSVIEELKKNRSIGWSFVDDWQGNYGLNEGKYYALIEIPRNFSSGLVSMTTPAPQKPVVTYRVNEKLNAIAAKITNVAKDKLVSNIESNFVKTVNQEAMEILKTSAQEAKFSKTQVSELQSTMKEANGNILQLKKYIEEANTDSKSFQKYLSTTSAMLPKMTEQIDSLEKVTQAGKSLTLRTQQTVQSIASDLNGDMVQIQTLNSQNQALLAQLKTMNGNTIDSDVIGTMKQTVNICSSVDTMLRADMENIQTLNKTYNLSSLTFLYDSMNYLDRLVRNEKSTLNTLIPLVSAGSAKSEVAAALNDLSSISGELATQAQTVSNSFYTKGSPVLNTMVSNLTMQMDDTNSILELTKSLLPQLNALATFGGASSRLSVQQANKLNDLLTTLQTDLNKLTDKMDTLTGEDIDRIVDIVENHPSEVADFLSSPLEVKEVDVYEGGTFGVGLTPFYTVLAIWVGALLACALLSVECEDEIAGVRLNLKQKHFGKMQLFLFLSLIQSTIITLGDVVVLGVHPANFGLMLGFSMLCSVTFTVMIFTLVSIFGNVGKAIAVVIMVFQIAGAGGIYPIQTNPKIFGALEPLWPFTYAINGFREAIAGPVWDSVYRNVWAMLAFTGAFLLMAVLKKPFHWLNRAMEHKFQEAEL